MTKMLAVALALIAPAAFGGLLVTEVSGKVKIEGKGAVATLSEIPDGSRIMIPAGAHLVAVDLASGREFSLKGGSNYLVSAHGPAQTDGKVVEAKPLPAKNLPAVKIATGKVAQATLVMRSLGGGGNVPLLQSPVRTTITTDTPMFHWSGVEGANNYHLKLTTYEGDTLWELSTHGTSAQLPADKKLTMGERYTWRVEALGDSGPLSDSSAGFAVMAQDIQQRLTELKPEAGAPFSRRVLYAAQLLQAGAKEDAKEQWKALYKEHPNDEVLKNLAE